MSPRGRVFFFVTLAAVVASGVVVLGVLATRSHVAAAAKPRAGLPPLALDLGLRTDPEARALQQAQQFYKDKQAAKAGEIFGRYHSLEARVGSALATWPDGSVKALQALAAEHPRSSLLALHLGLAFYWTRHDAQAVTAWQAARRLQPDTFYAVRATDLLHPQYAPGLPTYVPSFPMPLAVQVLPPVRKFSALQRADVSDIPETAQVGELVNVWREDEPAPSLTQEQALAHAPDTDGEYFRVGAIQE